MTGNPIRFYAADGSGFEFIADCLIDIDKRNPQLAARMALPLTRMGAYSDARQHQMRQVLNVCKRRCNQPILVKLSKSLGVNATNWLI